MDSLPESIIKIEQLRIEKGLGKVCKCTAKRFLLDEDNHRVVCRTCGAQIDPYEALKIMAIDWDRINKELEAVFKQRKELDNYKPHLRVIKELEAKTRTGPNKMYPVCPACDEPFTLDELTRFYGAKFVTGQIIERMDRQRKEREAAEQGEVRK